MSNGYYTSPTINWPAPRNLGGYNAQQLSLQKNIQENVLNFNTKIKNAKTFLNAPGFSDHVKDFWGERINEYSEAQNSYVAGDSSGTDSRKSQEDLEILWNSWKNVAPFVAALGEEVKKYGGAGELDKLNDPNLETLLVHMQRNDGSVTLQHEGNKLYLTGKGEIDEKNVNGESTGNKLPWEYDLDIEAFLQIIGFNSYEQGDDEQIFSNLNNIIRKRVTEGDMNFQSTIEAAITQSSRTYKVKGAEKNGKAGKDEERKFIYEDLLKNNLNYGGTSGLARVDAGSTLWVGTEDSPALMNSPDFDSYYANVLYQDYQPHYNEESEIDWLIDYDDNGNEVDRVKPWNLADEGIWAPTRDMLTNRAVENESAVNQALMVRLKPEYQEVLDNKYGGNMRDFQENFEEGNISADPFKYYEGINGFAKQEWKKAQEYNMPEETSIEPEADPIIYGSTQGRAQAIASMVKQTREDPEILLGGPGRFESGASVADYFNALEMTDEESGGNYTVSDYLSNLPIEIKGKLNKHKSEISLVGNDDNPDQMLLKIMDSSTGTELRKVLKKQGWAWEGINQTGSDNDKYWAKAFNIRDNEDVEKLWQLILAELEKVGAKVKAKR